LRVLGIKQKAKAKEKEKEKEKRNYTPYLIPHTSYHVHVILIVCVFPK
jgi:hypothetical protein